MTDENKAAAAPADSPTKGMNLGQRVAHVGGRVNAQGYVEFGSEMAVDALIQHALRDHDQAAQAELARLKNLVKDFSKIIHDMVVAEQAAWIEWRHGRGAEAGMIWIQNGLVGPGHIPDEDEPYGKEAQAWFDANRSNPFPTCFCGRPSNSLWMGKGFCSNAHYAQYRAQVDADAQKKED